MKANKVTLPKEKRKKSKEINKGIFNFGRIIRAQKVVLSIKNKYVLVSY